MENGSIEAGVEVDGFEDEENIFVETVQILLDAISEQTRHALAMLPSGSAAQVVGRLRAFLLADSRSLVRFVGSHLVTYQPRGRFCLELGWSVELDGDDDGADVDNRATLLSLLDLAAEARRSLPDDGVRQRCEHFAVGSFSPALSPSTAFRHPVCGGAPPRVSTPLRRAPPPRADSSDIFGCANASALDGTCEAARIAQLESQLADMQKQMMRIVQHRELGGVMTPPLVLEVTERSRSSSSRSSDSGMGVDDDNKGAAASAIPPPPPPPPVESLRGPTSAPLVRGKGRSSANASVSSRPSLVDVMTELKNKQIKLRKVARSPGGTPRRRTPAPTDGQHMDAGSFIAAALKKKFAKARASNDSPASEHNASAGAWDSSPDATPKKRRRSVATREADAADTVDEL